jgi:hypothetical protein
MKMRTSRTPVGTARAKVRKYEIGKTRYIAAQPARNGPNEVKSCSSPLA